MNLSPGTLAQLACILEASARKPGNVHPGRSFEDSSYLDFILSAAAIGPPLDRARARPVGETVLEAVQATREVVGQNTNLGIILLIAPLAALEEEVLSRAAAEREALRAALGSVLSKLTLRDAELVYEAIRVASPGGLGEAEAGDVRGPPAGTLLEMMALAQDRDLVARQYANGYHEVLEEALPMLEEALKSGRALEDAILLCQLDLVSRHGDSLIARKRGKEESDEAARRAREVFRSLWPRGRSTPAALDDFDRWLGAEGHERNPGATADLTAAALFLAVASGIISLPIHLETSCHGEI
jgi:triphosphoribosyl-dephospho-CoA synthase